MNSTVSSTYNSIIGSLSSQCLCKSYVFQSPIQEVPYIQVSFPSFLPAWNTDKIYFYLQILFFIFFHKTKYLLLYSHECCRISSSKCLRDTLVWMQLKQLYFLLNLSGLLFFRLAFYCCWKKGTFISKNKNTTKVCVIKSPLSHVKSSDLSHY